MATKTNNADPLETTPSLLDSATHAITPPGLDPGGQVEFAGFNDDARIPIEPKPGQPGYDPARQLVNNLEAADTAMGFSPQERRLYQHHLNNLDKNGGVQQDDGTRSTALVMDAESGGKTYLVPTVWDGKKVSPDEAFERARKAGLDNFPSYASSEEAQARYMRMHGFMEGDRPKTATVRGKVEDETAPPPAKLPDDARPETNLGLDPDKKSPLYSNSVVSTKQPLLLKQSLEARAAGYSWDEIRNSINQAWEQARAEGKSDIEIQRYYGFKDPQPFNTQVRDYLRAALNGIPAPKTADGFGEGIIAGLQASVLGLQWRGALPEVQTTPESDWQTRAGNMLGQAVGDLPYNIAGGVMGFFAGAAAGAPAAGVGAVPGSVLGAGAGTMALPAALRSIYVDGLTKGGYTGPTDFATRVVGIMVDTAKASIEGAAAAFGGSLATQLATKAGVSGGVLGTDLTGVLGPQASSLIVGQASFLAAHAALEQKLPTYQDLADAALSTLVIHGVTKTAEHAPVMIDNLAKHWAATGERPADAVNRAKKDPAFYNSLVSDTQELPTAGSAATKANEQAGGSFVIMRQPGAFDETAKPIISEAHDTTTRFGVSNKIAPGINVEALTPEQAASILFEKVWKPLRLEDAAKEWHGPVLEAAGKFGLDKVREWLHEAQGDLGNFKAMVTREMTPEALAMIEGGSSNKPQYLATDKEQRALEKSEQALTTQTEGGGGGGKTPPPRVPNWSQEAPKRLPAPENADGPGPNGWANPWDKVGEAIVEAGHKPGEGWLRRAYRELFDNDSPINRLWNTMTRGDKIPDENNFQFYRRLEEGTASRARAMIELDQFDAQGKVIGPSLRKIIDSVGGKDARTDLMRYAVAFRSLRERENGIATSVDETAARQVIEAGQLKYGDKLAVAVAQLADYRTNLMRYLRDKEFISDAEFQLYTRDAKYGIPGWREKAPAAARAPGSTTFNPVHTLEGSETARLVDPYTALVKETMLRLQMADRNASALALLREARKHGLVEERNVSKPRPTDAEGVTTLKEGETSYSAKGGKMSEDGITDLIETVHFGAGIDDALGKLMPHIKLEAGDVPIFENGRKIVARFEDPQIATILRQYDAPQSNIIMDALASVTKPVRWAIVIGNPLFAPSISVMDMLFQAGTRPGGIIGKNSAPMNNVVGLIHTFMGTEKFNEAVRMGVVQNVFEKMNQDVVIKGILSGDNPNLYKTAWNVTGHPLEWWANSWFQSAQVGRFIRGREAGETPLRAAIEASEAVQQRGSFGGPTSHAINRIVPFFNAALNGLEKLVQAQFGVGKQTITGDQYSPLATGVKLAALVTVPMLVNYFTYKDDPRYRAMHDYEKDNYIFLGPAVGDDYEGELPPLLKFRLPPFISLVYGGIPRRIAQASVEQDPHAWDDFSSAFLKGLAPPGVDTFAPSFMTPVIENITNYSFITGRPIVPPRLEKGVLTQDRFQPYTTKTARALGAIMGNTSILRNVPNMSPIEIDHLINGWTGQAGQTLLRGAEEMLGASGAIDLDRPAARWFDTPIFRSFLSRTVGGSAKPTVDFMERMGHYQQVHGSLVKALEDDDIGRFKSILAAHPNSAGMHKWQLSKQQKVMLPQDKAEFVSALNEVRSNVDADLANNVLGSEKALKNMWGMVKMITLNNGAEKLTPDDQRKLLDQVYRTMMQMSELAGKNMDALGMK